jgi:transcriptional regulator with XRE-family HTH domain
MRRIPQSRLREERLRRQWSLTRLSALTGIASSDLGMLERGLRPAYTGWQQRIARAFKMPADELFPKGDALESNGARN